MTTTLQSLNFETAKLPGLTVRALANGDRFSLIVENESGAIELWSRPGQRPARHITGDDTIGGVETHSPKPLYDDDDPAYNTCHVLGGNCWADGSSLAYVDTFLPLIRAGDTVAILHGLADWHESHFPAAGTEEATA
jgi:hypothetical protein